MRHLLGKKFSQAEAKSVSACLDVMIRKGHAAAADLLRLAGQIDANTAVCVPGENQRGEVWKRTGRSRSNARSGSILSQQGLRWEKRLMTPFSDAPFSDGSRVTPAPLDRGSKKEATQASRLIY
jgi:hypothetical protein